MTDILRRRKNEFHQEWEKVLKKQIVFFQDFIALSCLRLSRVQYRRNRPRQQESKYGMNPFLFSASFSKKDICSSLMLKPNNTDLKGPQVSKVPIKTITARLI